MIHKVFVTLFESKYFSFIGDDYLKIQMRKKIKLPYSGQSEKRFVYCVFFECEDSFECKDTSYFIRDFQKFYLLEVKQRITSGTDSTFFLVPKLYLPSETVLPVRQPAVLADEFTKYADDSITNSITDTVLLWINHTINDNHV